MRTYALVSGGVVVNLINWDGAAPVNFGDGITAVAAPDGVSIGYTYDGTNFAAPAPAPNTETLAELKARLSDDVDSTVAVQYATWQRFQAEYQARESAANAFKSAGYVGDPGIYVTGYATAAGVTNQQAADTILAQADMLNGALASIGAQRMRKYAIQGAADAASAQAVHDDIIAQVNTIIAGIT